MWHKLTFWSRTGLRTLRYDTLERISLLLYQLSDSYCIGLCVASYLTKLLNIKFSPPGYSPFLRRSTVILWPSSLRHVIFGVGKPSALQVKLIFWFSRTATVDCVLSASKIFGGTKNKNKQNCIT